jgi:outer membrane protein insertion porin family
MRLITFLLFALLTSAGLHAQQESGPIMDHGSPRKYTIGGLTVSGAQYTDANAVKLFSGLQVGDEVTVPGERISEAIRNLWEQKLFSDVRIEATEIRNSVIFLNILVSERARLSRFKFNGISKSDADKLREDLQLVRGQQVNEATVANARMAVRRYYVNKGFLNCTVNVVQEQDTALLENSEMLLINVDRGPRVRIGAIEFNGNQNVKDKRLARAMKNTKAKKWWNVFSGSKFIAKDYREDLNKVLDVYQEEGFRNAAIVRDTILPVDSRRIRIVIDLDEDRRFRFRNVRFTGNTKHSSEELSKILNIEPGDVYNKKLLDGKLFMSQSGLDISSLYLDDGYLSFYPEVVELADGDSIDLEIRMREGKQYRVRNVIIKGNSKTHDHVIRREVRTRPGQLFNRSDVLRTQRELAVLGYFDPEKLGVNPIQDPRTGTVDLEYTVEEKPSDRLELSGGYGAGRLILTVGLSFTNFSMRNILNAREYTPLPAGDGQTLSLRAQTNGSAFQNYSLTFVEPWLGGRKPNSFSVSAFHTVQTNGADKFINTTEGRVRNPALQRLLITGGSLGLGKRLTVPDDYFIWSQSLNFQLYDLQNWNTQFAFSNGTSRVLSFQQRLGRNSVDDAFFPRSGSEINLSVKATPPWSRIFPAFGAEPVDYANASDAERFAWAEFHKWKFTTRWYTRVTRSKTRHDLVLMTRAGFGFLGLYNQDIGKSPFERFYLGGAAITGFQLDGREIVGLRGYDDFSISPSNGSFFVSKYTTELRFPVSLNPSATIFMLTFLEAGNTWEEIDRFDPFGLYRSAGVGLRLNLPMFGPMGLDYGWRLDDLPSRPDMARSQFHFTIGIDFGEL